MDLIVAVKLAHTAVQFVEGGPLAEALAELNMGAAITALNKAHQARDKHSQVWSAVNHLEGAQVALETKLRRIGIVAIHPGHYLELEDKYRYVQGLVAICYRYLGEEQLAQQAITKAREPRRKRPLWAIAPAMTIPLVIEIYANVFDRTTYDNKYRIDWEQFELPPRALPSPSK